MKEMTRKLTAEIDRDTYMKISKELHHGQLTQLVRAFATALENMLEESKREELYGWLYGSKPLLLPPNNRTEEERDGADYNNDQ